uniref:Uncharacterized protein n=1 Tax=Rhizophora mucronata TaxID=61149 RepID=A0A2P2NFI5_RHIMU
MSYLNLIPSMTFMYIRTRRARRMRRAIWIKRIVFPGNMDKILYAVKRHKKKRSQFINHLPGRRSESPTRAASIETKNILRKSLKVKHSCSSAKETRPH